MEKQEYAIGIKGVKRDYEKFVIILSFHNGNQTDKDDYEKNV